MNGIDYLAFVISFIKDLKRGDRVKLIKYINTLPGIKDIEKADIGKTALQFLNIDSHILEKAVSEAESVNAECIDKDISVVSFYNPLYPPLLREIYCPPAVLYVKGMLPYSEIPSLSIVGTRNGTFTSLKASYDTACSMAENGIPVISGLARGVDAKAHKGALDAGGYTAAVLGCGVDVIYPGENRSLAQSILSENGALISEYRPGTEPEKYHFPERNRIISGISRGTLIVHAPEKSGSMITASFALDEGRDVFVHSLCFSVPDASGGLSLLDDGASEISCAGDILKEWKIKAVDRKEKTEYRYNENIYNVRENNYSSLAENNNGLYYWRKMYA